MPCPYSLRSTGDRLFFSTANMLFSPLSTGVGTRQYKHLDYYDKGS
ncbi:hypothetical protein [Microseira wollei]|nr:hypothetical protein [Microseira wollei]